MYGSVAPAAALMLGAGCVTLCGTSSVWPTHDHEPEPEPERKPETTSASPGVKCILAVRHCQDEVEPRTTSDTPRGHKKRQGRTLGSRFHSWHTPTFRAERRGRDPCLTDVGVQAAGSGVEDDALRLRLNEVGYGGVAGGLEPVGSAFEPELIVCSPLSRAVQTALVMFNHSSAPLIVHPALKEIKADYTAGGKFPGGKPGCQGLPRSALEAALAAHPRSSGASADTSLLNDDWFDPHEPHASQTARVDEFERWLMSRPERSVAVVSHGGCLRYWLQRDLAHGQYCCAELSAASGLRAGEVCAGVQQE